MYVCAVSEFTVIFHVQQKLHNYAVDCRNCRRLAKEKTVAVELSCGLTSMCVHTYIHTRFGTDLTI